MRLRTSGLRGGLRLLAAVALFGQVVGAPPIGAAPAVVPSAREEATTIVAIERPARDVTVAGSVLIEGWAADPALPSGTGVEAVELYLDGAPDVGGVPIGTPTYGGVRDDVAARLGDARFAPSGYRFRWKLDGVAPGPHTIYAFARNAQGVWAFTTQPITVSERACLPQVVIDSLAPNATVSGALTFTGYAADPGSAEGTGVSALALYVDNPPEAGGAPVATATYGADRPDAATAFGEQRFTPSGFTLAWDASAVPDGAHTLYFVATGLCGDVATPLPLVVSNAGAAPAATAPPPDAAAPPPPADGSAPAPAASTVAGTSAGGCITVNVDVPGAGATVSPPFPVSGTAYDPKSASDTGVSRVAIYSGPKDSGGKPIGGDVRYGLFRRVVSETIGVRAANSGFSTTLNVQFPNGPTTLYIYASGACGEGWRSVLVNVDNSLPAGTIQGGQAATTLPAGTAAASAGGSSPAGGSAGASAPPTGSGAPPATTAPAPPPPGSAPSSANAPQPPTNLQSTISGASVTLTWGASPGGNVRDYVVWQSTDGTTFTQVQTVPGTQTTYTLSNLNPATVYYFFVVARNQAGDTSARSNLAGPVVLGGGDIAPPSNLQVTIGSGNTATLTWTKSSSPNVSAYYIFLGTNNTTPVQYTSTTADQSTTQVPLLNPGNNTYTFYVTAVAGNHQSKPSNIVGPCSVTGGCTNTNATGSPGSTPGTFGLPGTGTVPNPTPTPGTTTPSPGTTVGAPTNLTATLSGVNTVLLNWTPPVGTAPTAYQIYYSLNGGQYQSPGQVQGNTTTAQVPNLTAGGSYTFYIVPLNGSTPGPQSNIAGPIVVGQATGTVPGTGIAPSNVQVNFPVGSSQAVVTWTPVTGYSVGGYTVLWQGLTSGQFNVFGQNSNSYTITNLTPNQTYTITVRAFDQNNQPLGTGTSVVATPGQFGTGAAGVTTPLITGATPLGGRRVQLVWQPVTGATTYRIYRDNVLVGQSATPTYIDTVPGTTPVTVQYSISAVGANGVEGGRSANYPVTVTN